MVNAKIDKYLEEADMKEIKNYKTWEKICIGYEISLKNLEQSLKEERNNAYIDDIEIINKDKEKF